MKLKNILFIFIAVLSVSFSSCEKEYEDEARITYFPNFVMEGEPVVYHLVGTPYTDASVTATEDSKALEVNVSVVGDMAGYKGTTVKSDVVDKYIISYSAKNSDGYEGTASREVLVGPKGDLINSIEGIYVSDVQRGPAFVAGPPYNQMNAIFITKTGEKTYSISDAIGGYYYIGRAYGYDYAAQGAVITANNIATNDFTITKATIPGFGNVVEVTNFQVDPVSKKITFTGTGNFANGAFRVQLTQANN